MTAVDTRLIPGDVARCLHDLARYPDGTPIAPALDERGQVTDQTITVGEMRAALLDGTRDPVECGLWIYAMQVRQRRAARWGR